MLNWIMLKYVLSVSAIVLTSLGTVAQSQSVDYPEREGRPGAPFLDANLKLIVLSELLDNGEIDLGFEDEFAAFVLEGPYDYEAHSYSQTFALMDYLSRYPITEGQLKSVEGIYFDGGNTIYPFIFPFWTGEDEIFDVRSLEGIGTLSNLKEVGIYSMMDVVDLRELTILDKLESLEIGVSLINLDALHEIGALKKLEIMNDKIFEQVNQRGHPTQHVIESLKARGVDVWIHWQTEAGNERSEPYQ